MLCNIGNKDQALVRQRGVARLIGLVYSRDHNGLGTSFGIEFRWGMGRGSKTNFLF